MKKFTTLFLVVIMLFTLCAPVLAQGFTDIAGHWAEADILEAAGAGIVSGDGNGLFRPNDRITRGEYFKMLTAAVANESGIAIPETSTSGEHWAMKYFTFARDTSLYQFDYQNEISTAAGKVYPAVLDAKTADFPIERWEMAFLINGVLAAFDLMVNPEEGRLKDTAAIASYPEHIQEAIYRCATIDVIKGDEKANFNPAKYGTRAEAVVMIKRFLNSLYKIIMDIVEGSTTKGQEEEKEVINENVKTYTQAEIPTKNVKVKFTMENGKSFTAELYPDYAPQTVANFVALVKDGFYDGLTFHRVVNGFVAQGGDPKGNGTGGSGKNIYGEFAINGWKENTLSHETGVLSMARSGMPDSASSQFFICLADCKSLDGMYAAFGKVIEGMDVVQAFTKVERTIGGDGALSQPVNPIVMKNVELLK